MRIPDLDFRVFHPNATEEECAVILKMKDRYFLVPVPNRHEQPDEHFRIVKADIYHALKHFVPEGMIFGFAHTHLGHHHRVPSPHDIASMPEGKYGVVYHPSTESAVWYSNKGILKNGYRSTRR